MPVFVLAASFVYITSVKSPSQPPSCPSTGCADGEVCDRRFCASQCVVSAPDRSKRKNTQKQPVSLPGHLIENPFLINVTHLKQAYICRGLCARHDLGISIGPRLIFL